MRKILQLKIVATLMLFTSMAGAQTRTVSGKVTSAEDGSALPGVNVVLKGTTTGTSTDVDGKFNFAVPDGGGTLSFSFVGLKTQDIEIGDRTVIDVALTPDVNQLSEVVVTGYGSSTRQAFTGTAKTVSSESISKKNVPNVSRALMGEVAGVQVLNTSGQPGTVATVRIRGFGSATGNRDPLYVLDGVPLTDASSLNAINPTDIETTTVLKDASATAIYGTRGANGVILLNTRSGKGANSYVEVDAQSGTNFAALPRYNVIKSPEQYIGLSWESVYNAGNILGKTDPTAYANTHLFSGSGIDPAYNMWQYNGAPATAAQLIDPSTRTVNTSGITRLYNPESWGNYAFQAASRNQFDVKFGGSNNKTNYFTSVGYLGDKGYSINSDFKRFTARFNLNHEVYSWLHTAMNVGFARTETNFNGQSNDSGSIFWFVDNIPSIYPLFLKDATGKNVPDPVFGGSQFDYGGYGSGRGFGALTNPIGDATYDVNRTTRYEVNGNFSANVNILPGLTSENRFGFQYYDNKQVNRGNKFYGNSASQNGDLFNSISQLGYYNILNLVRYQKTYGDHNVEIMAAHEATESQTQVLNLDKYNLVDPNILDYNNAVVTNPITGYTNSYSLESIFGQVTYDYNNKYFFSGSLRRDGSSRFVKNKWGTFGSIGASWMISNEDFMQKQTIFSLLKLKASYGIMGDQGPNYYPGYVLFDVNNVNNKAALSFNSKGNPDLTWETSKMFQTGVEFGIGKYLTGTFDFYQKNTTNLFFTRGIGASAGIPSILVNDGALSNQGFEFDVTGHILKTKDYFINLGINGDIFNNKLTKMPIDPATGKQKILDNTSGGSLYGWSVGHSIYDFYIRESAGVNPTTGQALWTEYYNDTNGNGVLDSGEGIASLADFQAANPSLPANQLKKTTTTSYANGTLSYSGKSAIPKVKGAVNLSGGYKGIEINVQMLYSFGAYGFDGAYQSLMHSGQAGSNNWSTDILSRWQKDGDITNVPRLSNNLDVNQNGTSTRFLVKSNFLLLNNVRVTYNLPSSVVSSLKIKSASIWVSGDNLWIHSQRKGYNPFISQDGRSSIYTYAPLSTVSGGIKVKF